MSSSLALLLLWTALSAAPAATPAQAQAPAPAPAVQTVIMQDLQGERLDLFMQLWPLAQELARASREKAVFESAKSLELQNQARGLRMRLQEHFGLHPELPYRVRYIGGDLHRLLDAAELQALTPAEQAATKALSRPEWPGIMAAQLVGTAATEADLAKLQTQLAAAGIVQLQLASLPTGPSPERSALQARLEQARQALWTDYKIKPEWRLLVHPRRVLVELDLIPADLEAMARARQAALSSLQPQQNEKDHVRTPEPKP